MANRVRYLIMLCAVLFLAAAGAGPVPISTATADSAQPPDIDLRLSTDRNIGYSPLPLTVVGKMHGLNGANGNFCHPGVTWIVWNVERDLVTRSTSDPRCHHLDDRAYNPVVF